MDSITPDQDFRLRAAHHQWAIKIGIESSADVIKWAESEFQSTQNPDQALIDLTWCRADTPEVAIYSLLEKITGSLDPFDALRFALERLAAPLRSHPESLSRLAKDIHELAVQHEYTLPEDLSPLLVLCSNFDLCLSGILDRHDVEKELMEFIDQLSTH
ncbi:MAG: hypothetical protein MJA83_09330 [Gammaproteobacteria bacterium]|nr:hypothetical protein [Gammaproteobacteria bacterium]